MSYDCSMLFCIKVSTYEPTSIRYTYMSLILHSKAAKSRKTSQFLKNFLRILQKALFLMEIALEYHFTLYYFEKFIQIFLFFCKNFNFSLALGDFAP